MGSGLGVIQGAGLKAQARGSEGGEGGRGAHSLHDAQATPFGRYPQRCGLYKLAQGCVMAWRGLRGLTESAAMEKTPPSPTIKLSVAHCNFCDLAPGRPHKHAHCAPYGTIGTGACMTGTSFFAFGGVLGHVLVRSHCA